MEGSIETISWTQFKEEFLEKFYPTVYKDQKIEEIFKLEQGTMSVKDYEKKFLELVPFYCEGPTPGPTRGWAPLTHWTIGASPNCPFLSPP